MIFLRKRLRRASLDGRWFYLNDTNIDTGRRVKRFEFPFQEKPQAQDLGKKGQSISIAGFVAGANYRSDAENLIKACEKKGPLELFHPYYGRKKVICHSCRINENNIEGGIVYFSFQCFETIETVSSRFGLGNMPLSGAANLLSSASQTITETIDSANQVVGYLDELNDSILTTTEFFEKMISPLLHAEDSINNLSLALNDMKRTVQKDYYLGTTGMVHAMSNLLAVIAGSTLDESDPYHWTREFPPERIDPSFPFWPILLGSRAFIVGMQASQTFSSLGSSDSQRRSQSLQVLNQNVNHTLRDSERRPTLYRQLKDVNVSVIQFLFSNPSPQEPGRQIKKCLILEAYEERGGLDQLNSIRKEYSYGSTL